jgi:hypothetical protein
MRNQETGRPKSHDVVMSDELKKGLIYNVTLPEGWVNLE